MSYANGICRSTTGKRSCIRSQHCPLLLCPGCSFTKPPLALLLTLHSPFSSKESGSEEKPRTQPKGRDEGGREGTERIGGRKGDGKTKRRSEERE